MNLRTFGLIAIVTVGSLAALDAEAQQPPKVPRLCLLAPYSASGATRYNAFLQGLRALGYVVGRNITIDYLSADGQALRNGGGCCETCSER